MMILVFLFKAANLLYEARGSSTDCCYLFKRVGDDERQDGPYGAK